MDISGLAKALLEGALAQKYGPDFRQKQQAGQLALQQGGMNLQKTQGEIAGQDIQNQEGQARIPLIQEQAKGAGLGNQKMQDELDSIVEDKAALQAAAASGKIDNSNLAAQKAILAAREQKAQEGVQQAQIAHLGAETKNEGGKFAHEERVAQIHASAAGGAPMAVTDKATGNIIFVPRNQAASGAYEPKPAAATQAKVDQANRILEIRDSLVGSLKNPKIQQRLGPLAGRQNALQAMYGDPDPEMQRFSAELESFLAMQPALHGFRGTQAVSQFRQVANAGHLTPQALQAAIEGMSSAAESFSNHGGRGYQGGGERVPPGAGGGGIDPEVEKRLKALGY